MVTNIVSGCWLEFSASTCTDDAGERDPELCLLKWLHTHRASGDQCKELFPRLVSETHYKAAFFLHLNHLHRLTVEQITQLMALPESIYDLMEVHVLKLFALRAQEMDEPSTHLKVTL